MNRDMDLIRRILMKVEATEAGGILIPPQPGLGGSAGDISDHVYLLIDAGLVEGEVVEESGGEPNYWYIRRLTWEGHDFLEAARNDDRWEEAKETFARKGGGMVFSVFKELLIQTIKSQVLGSP